MKCKKCNKELHFDESILKEFIACPYCGKFFPKVLPPIESGTIEAELKKFADDFGGLEIFSEENSSRLAKSLIKLEAPFDVARDKLLVANIKNIPQKLYSVLDQPQNEQQQMVDLCLNEMTSFGLPQEFAKETISWLTHTMGMFVELEDNSSNKKELDTVKIKIEINRSSWSGKEKPPTEYDFPTCRIGKQIWLAKNLDLQIYGVDSKDSINPEQGKLYYISDNFCLSKTNSYITLPQGWRLPTEEDVHDMIDFIKSQNLEVAASLKSRSQWHGSGKKGTDDFGFSAFPTERDDDGLLSTKFWLSEKGETAYKVFSIDSNDNYEFKEINSGYVSKYKYACIRYVKDAEE